MRYSKASGLSLMLALILTAGCATKPPATKPNIPDPPAELMRPRSPDYLKRLERILFDSPLTPTTPPSPSASSSSTSQS